MSRSHVEIAPRSLTLLFAIAAVLVGTARGQDGQGARGRFITVRSPVTASVVSHLRVSLNRAAAEGDEVVVLRISGAGESEFEQCLKAARLVAEVESAMTVAYLEGQVSGHDLLIGLAADRIVAHPDARLGPVVTPPGDNDWIPIYKAAYGEILRRKGRDAYKPLVMAMIDPGLRLLRVELAEKETQLFVLESEAEQRLKGKTVVNRELLVDVNQTLQLDARQARLFGLVESLAATPDEVAELYGLPLGTAAREQKVIEYAVAAHVQVTGTVDYKLRDFLFRKCRELRSRGVNLLFLEIDSPGGLAFAGLEIANFLDQDLSDVHTVAWVRREALSAAAFIAFGCDEIVMAPRSRIGDCGVLQVGFGIIEYAPEKVLTDVKQQLKVLAKSNGWPEAIMEGCVDKDVVVVKAVNRQTGAIGFFLKSELDQERWQVVEVVKREGEFFEADAERALELGLAVATAGNIDQLCDLYGVDPARLINASPTWVDGLVYFLSRPFVRFLLLTIGIIAIYVELKIPGIGLPSAVAVVCFTLIFWSEFLNGTATALEILLFLVGLVLVLIEVFLLPGVVVFGLTGGLMMLASLVLASQSFLVPTNEREWNELLLNLTGLVMSLLSVWVFGALLARYLHRIPGLNQILLIPEQSSASAVGEVGEGAEQAADMVGAVGVAITPLRPAGRIQIGDEFYDVVSEGEFIERGATVQVIGYHGRHMVVRPVKGDLDQSGSDLL